MQRRRERAQRESTSFSVEIKETCVSKNLEETVRLQSEKREEWIQEIMGERLQGIAGGASSAPRLASSSAALFLGRNECPETHCSPTEQEEREDKSATKFEIRGKMEERAGWRGQNESQIVREGKRNGRLVTAAETSKERAEWCRLQRKNLSILGLLKRKEWPQCHRESSWEEPGAAFAKRKRNRAVSSEYQIMRGKRDSR